MTGKTYSGKFRLPIDKVKDMTPEQLKAYFANLSQALQIKEEPRKFAIAYIED